MKLSLLPRQLRSWWSMSVVPTSGERIIATAQTVLSLVLLVFGLLARVMETLQTKPEAPPRLPEQPSAPSPPSPVAPDRQEPVVDTNKADRLPVEVDR